MKFTRMWTQSGCEYGHGDGWVSLYAINYEWLEKQQNTHTHTHAAQKLEKFDDCSLSAECTPSLAYISIENICELHFSLVLIFSSSIYSPLAAAAAAAFIVAGIFLLLFFICHRLAVRILQKHFFFGARGRAHQVSTVLSICFLLVCLSSPARPSFWIV